LTFEKNRWITTNDFDAISEIVTDYFNKVRPGRSDQDDWLMGLKTALSKGEREIFASYEEDDQPVGFATFPILSWNSGATD